MAFGFGVARFALGLGEAGNFPVCIKTVAEWVQDEESAAILADWGCDLYQGFLGAGPLSEEELRRFVAASMAEAA